MPLPPPRRVTKPADKPTRDKVLAQMADIERAAEHARRKMRRRDPKARGAETSAQFEARGGLVQKLPPHASANPPRYAIDPSPPKRRAHAYPRRGLHA